MVRIAYELCRTLRSNLEVSTSTQRLVYFLWEFMVVRQLGFLASLPLSDGEDGRLTFLSSSSRRRQVKCIQQAG